MDFKQLEKEGIYDYIENHYWELSKEELKNIALEGLWALSVSNGDINKANVLAIRTIKEFYEEEN